jgi:hypothetical protein
MYVTEVTGSTAPVLEFLRACQDPQDWIEIPTEFTEAALKTVFLRRTLPLLEDNELT